MALTHHCIVALAGIRVNTPSKGQYVLLGDDIVIANPSLAKAYLEIMDELKVPISLAKTHVSKDMYEFAKRLVYKGTEITPLPIPSIMEN